MEVPHYYILNGLKKIISLFWGADSENCKAMMQTNYFQPFEKTDPLLIYDPPDAVQQIQSFIRDFSNAASLFDSLETSYVRLFIGDKNGIVAPLYESCYEFDNAPLMGKSAVEMNRRFASKGLSIAHNIHEPPDHLSIELEYLYFLLEKGWNEGDHQLIDEAAAFASQLMLPWVSKLHRRLSVEDRCRFYPLMASILIGILNRIGGFDKWIGSLCSPASKKAPLL